MSARATVVLTNSVVTFGLEYDPSQSELAQRLIGFLAPQFWAADQGVPHFQVILEDFGLVPAEWLSHDGDPITIRRSDVPVLQLSGRSFRPDQQTQIVVDADTRTAYKFDYPAATLTMFCSPGSFMHLIEIVRSSALLVEEAAGTVLLHATASLHDDSCYLIIGEKGAGKTTTLLHLVIDYGHEFFSGDKVLLSRGPAGVIVRGWPDYPRIGIGTLRRFDSLAADCGVRVTFPNGSAKPADRRELIEPEVFRRALPPSPCTSLGRVAALVLPSISMEETKVSFVQVSNEGVAGLERFVEHPHQFAAVQWHTFLQDTRCTAPADDRAVLELFCHVPWLAVAGDGDISVGTFAAWVRSGQYLYK